SLRKGLLAKGKPLNKISLSGDNLFVLKKFLSHCGLLQKDVENFLRKLTESNPSGEINLSEFFSKINKFGPIKKKINETVILESSAIPHIESILRDFHLKPEEVDHALGAARIKGGGLDLNKFIEKLKTIHVRMGSTGQKTIDQALSKKISEKLENLGIQIPDKEKTGQISIKVFIAALERMTGRLHNGDQLPTDVKASIGRILEKVVVSEEKKGPVSSMPPLFTTGPDILTPKEKTGKKRNPVKVEDTISHLKAEERVSDKKGLEKEQISHLVKKAGLPSEPNPGRGLKSSPRQAGPNVNSETKPPEVPQDISHSIFSETFRAATKQDTGKVRGTLPAYLIDQVGKQISRSIQRGDNVIKLQLKPPELGAVKVEMDIKDNVLKLGMITENNSVKEILLSSVHELRDALVEHGVKVEKLDVQINNHFNHSLNSQEERLKDGQRQMKGRNGASLAADTDFDNSHEESRDRTTGEHLLNLMA
ncbi:MAG: flagellar hook-length control protein FliK, partial [Thermodesulfobacteriota bacterium]|nr:flagellar hook-length control protein FliK [Thermodesulfobacteriota bacterium]